MISSAPNYGRKGIGGSHPSGGPSRCAITARVTVGQGTAEAAGPVDDERVVGVTGLVIARVGLSLGAWTPAGATTVWSTPVQVSPEGIGGAGFTPITSVSCVDARLHSCRSGCTIPSLLFERDGGRVGHANPNHINHGVYWGFNSVSCTAVGDCTAVGSDARHRSMTLKQTASGPLQRAAGRTGSRSPL